MGTIFVFAFLSVGLALLVAFWLMASHGKPKVSLRLLLLLTILSGLYFWRSFAVNVTLENGMWSIDRGWPFAEAMGAGNTIVEMNETLVFAAERYSISTLALNTMVWAYLVILVLLVAELFRSTRRLSR